MATSASPDCAASASTAGPLAQPMSASILWGSPTVSRMARIVAAKPGASTNVATQLLAMISCAVQAVLARLMPVAQRLSSLQREVLRNLGDEFS